MRKWKLVRRAVLPSSCLKDTQPWRGGYRHGEELIRRIAMGDRSCRMFTSPAEAVRKKVEVIDFKQPVPYLDAFYLQQQLRKKLIDNKKQARAMKADGTIAASETKNGGDKIILLEHCPVYTLGRRTKLKDLLFMDDHKFVGEEQDDATNQILNLTRASLKNAAEMHACRNDPFNQKLQEMFSQDFQVYRIDRGGEITYHCPGQLVCYFIFDLDSNHKRDLHWFVRSLEEVVISLLAANGIEAFRDANYTGVWVPLPGSTLLGKIAAIGMSASQWVSMHGFSLNVTCDLSGFSRIHPCGIDSPDRTVTSIAALSPKFQLEKALIEDLKLKVIEQIVEIYGFSEIEYSPRPDAQLDTNLWR